MNDTLESGGLMPRSLAEMVREFIDECEKEYNSDEYVADNSRHYYHCHHNPPHHLLVEGEQVQLHDGGAERSQVSGDQRCHTVEKFLTHQRSSCYKT